MCDAQGQGPRKKKNVRNAGVPLGIGFSIESPRRATQTQSGKAAIPFRISFRVDLQAGRPRTQSGKTEIPLCIGF